jgi:Bacteriophage tail sheath protein
VTDALTRGAPGIYLAPARVERAYRGVRLDILGVVGVAPRGPVGKPMRIESWSEYQRLFGGFEGRGRLPYSIAAFFDQGGERAHVVRVAPRNEPPSLNEVVVATAVYRLADAGPGDGRPPIRLAAANEGAWGNGLRIDLAFDVASRFQLPLPSAPDGGEVAPRSAHVVPLPDGIYMQVGSLLRVTVAGSSDRELCWVDDVAQQDVGSARRRVALLDRDVTALATDEPRRTTVDVIEGRLTIVDRDRRFARSEEHVGLGLSPLHPRWLLDVLRDRSTLVAPVDGARVRVIEPATTLLSPIGMALEQRGRNRNDGITADDFFDPDWDPREDERESYGVHALLSIPEIGLLIAPDLGIDPVPAVATLEPDPEPAPDACFHPCPPACGRGECPGDPATDDEDVVEPPALPLYELVTARTREGIDEWARRQRLLVDVAERVQTFVVLLDVPPELDVRAISDWRASFDSSFAAAYHPWLGVARDDGRTDAVFVPPSAFAAGITAARERRLGLPWGPANELAVGAVMMRDRVSGEQHDRIHPMGINAFVAAPGGIRLTAARTLARNPAYRQLSVRRLMLMLRLTITRDSQWMVFENNNEELRSTVRFHLTNFLRQLQLGGAFAGATEADSFFVRCDEQLNPQSTLEAGRLILEVGVAPVEPQEFIVLRVERTDLGDTRMEERSE